MAGRTDVTTSSNPTWYDVLGISSDATPGEIKAAWRNATDKFEPGSGSGQFRMFNEAADVLLDPERRATYDASLAASVNTSQRAPTGGAAAQGREKPSIPPSTHVDLKEERKRERRERRTERDATRQPEKPASRRARLLTLLLALLTVAAVVAAVLLALEVRKDSRVAEARDSAPAAAERAAEGILAYDYKTLPADRDRAETFMTPGFGKKYLQNFELLEKQEDGTPGAAVQTRTTVTASVLGSGIINVRDDGGAAEVLVYVNQVSTRPGRDPQIFQNRVAMTMEKNGSRWLVDDLKSY